MSGQDEVDPRAAELGRLEGARSKLSRLLSDHWVKLVLAVVVAVLGASALVTITGPSQDGNDCSIQGGDNNRIDCGRGTPPEPSATVMPGEQPNTWILQLRNWEANSTLELELRDPAGNMLDLGELSTRRVDASGAADTANGRFFWIYEAGETQGAYVLTVQGEDTDGKPETKDAPFEVPDSR